MLMLTTTEQVEIVVAVTSGAVALATLYLGLKTRGMTRETKRVAEATELEAKAVAEQSERVAGQAAATEEQARISAEALRASIRPWLTRVDATTRVEVRALINLDEPGRPLDVDVWLRNVGPGIAVIPPEGCQITGVGTKGAPVHRPGFVDQPVLPPGGVARIGFRVGG